VGRGVQQASADRGVQKQRELRGLFEFNLSGEALDAYVKKQVNDYREQAKAFGLAK
jgi:putative tricarboxylic transport membrane protein